MSRIGKNPVIVPDGVTVEVKGQDVKVKGKLGELTLAVHEAVSVKLEDNAEGKKQVVLAALSEERKLRMLWPTFRNHVKNMVIGVSEGYTKNLDIQGVGYRANLQGSTLVLQLGYSHDIQYAVPSDIKVAVEKQTKISISGIDKQKVGQVAAEIIAYRPPEPYKGKGVRYEGQQVLRKEGKKK
ncbi:50S ribosomal protein L6 [Micavibrio aeruginosavorus]|uniref:50S ribosomal protein L6 n=1 Tax=Micavibrio aeruginosavorus TaxID=349221 RepID=UPI003F4A92FA